MHTVVPTRSFASLSRAVRPSGTVFNPARLLISDACLFNAN